MTMLSPCPSSPNCVSSLAEKESQRVQPFAVRTSIADTLKRLATICREQPRCAIESQSATYLHAVCVTAILRFRDDLEFMADLGVTPPVIHVRSASRIGYSDLGANRKRVERFRELLDRSYQNEHVETSTPA